MTEDPTPIKTESTYGVPVSKSVFRLTPGFRKATGPAPRLETIDVEGRCAECDLPWHFTQEDVPVSRGIHDFTLSFECKCGHVVWHHEKLATE